MKDPAFLFYSNDFLSGTMLMTDEQVGKYIKLLCLQHQIGRLKEKDMLKICKTYDEDIFLKFIKDDDGNYYNERLEEEIERRKKYSESRRQNRQNSQNKAKEGQEENLDDEDMKNICKSYDKDMKNICESYDEHMETETETININKNNNLKEKNKNKKIEVAKIDKAQMMRRLRAERQSEGNIVTKMLPYIEKDIEKNIEKELETEKTKDNFQKVIDFYNNNIGQLTPYGLNILESYKNELENDVIIYAMQKSVESNKRNMQYIKAILNNWTKAGIHTMIQVKDEEAVFKQKNQTKGNKSINRGYADKFFDTIYAN